MREIDALKMLKICTKVYEIMRYHHNLKSKWKIIKRLMSFTINSYICRNVITLKKGLHQIDMKSQIWYAVNKIYMIWELWYCITFWLDLALRAWSYILRIHLSLFFVIWYWSSSQFYNIVDVNYIFSKLLDLFMISNEKGISIYLKLY